MQLRKDLPMLSRVALIIITGFVVSALLFLIVYKGEKKIISAEFQLRAEGYAAAIQLALDNQVEVIDSLGSLYMSSMFVERREFRDFVKGALKRHKTIKALEWAPRVMNSARRGFQEAVRQEGLAGYEITELRGKGSMVAATERDEYFPVYYLEPLSGNESALGFDLASETSRLNALTLSRDFGQIVTTSLIGLVQEGSSRPGFLMFRPVYSAGLPQETLEQRRASLKGFAVGVYIVYDLVRDALNAVPTGLDFLIEDPTVAHDRYVHFHSSRSRAVPVELEGIYEREPDLSLLLTLKLPARRWDITFWPSPEFLSERKHMEKWIVLALGIAFTLSTSLFIEINMMRARRNRELASTLKRSLHEKEVLLREIHHRVKNNMAIILSLLRLQAKHSGDEGIKSMLMDSQNRIKSMALVHEKLYHSKDLADINLSDYVQELLSHLILTFGKEIDLSLDINISKLDIDTMIPCGLILNELVTNSLKHAFRGVDTPRINVSMKAIDGMLRLVYTDNGTGVPDHVEFPPSDSLGLQIISMLAYQLNGSVELDRSTGTKFIIDFKPYTSGREDQSTNA